MGSILLTPPEGEPLSLDEAKAFLRVEHSDDDEVIAALVSGARGHVESQTRRALITQHWRIVADAWPESGRLPVRPAPLQELTAACVYDLEGLAHDIDIQAFVPDIAVSALAKHDARIIIIAINEERLRFLQSLKTWAARSQKRRSTPIAPSSPPTTRQIKSPPISPRANCRSNSARRSWRPKP
jgi:hypothetical protein